MANPVGPSGTAPVPRRHEIDELVTTARTALAARLAQTRHEREELRTILATNPTRVGSR